MGVGVAVSRYEPKRKTEKLKKEGEKAERGERDERKQRGGGCHEYKPQITNS